MRIENKKFGSYSSDEPRIIAERKREKDTFKQFEGEKVTIKYGQRADLFSESGGKQGRIMLKNNHFVFVPKGARNKWYDLTLGLYDGFYATLTVNEILEGWVK